jgi:DNA-binding response OmpR family regulator
MKAAPIVLFIDDDDKDGTSTFHRLAKLGFTPQFHRGPFGTLTAIRDTRCDLVLLDVNMPGLDGPALVRVIRHTYNHLPVLLYSNMETSVLDRVGRHIGADGAIAKRASDEDFAHALQQALAEVERRMKSRASDQRTSA